MLCRMIVGVVMAAAAILGGCAGKNVIRVDAAPGFAPPANSRVAFILSDASGRVDRGGQAQVESDCIGSFMKQGYLVVERAKLDSIIKEHKLFESGLMSDSDALSAGKFANARGVMIVQVANLELTQQQPQRNNANTGGATWRRGDLRLTARWIDTEIGVVQWNANGNRKINTFDFDVDMRDELAQLVRGTLEMLPQAGGAAISSGDQGRDMNSDPAR